jgi:hypothetical protein
MRAVILRARPGMRRILTAVPGLSTPDCADRLSERASAGMFAVWLLLQPAFHFCNIVIALTNFR